MDEQQACIASYTGEGFVKIKENQSPIIFNMANPIYLKKGDNFIVVDADGYLVSWDHSNPVSRNLILAGNDRAIENHGDDLILEDDEDLD